ncbi:ABC transporter permease [Alphaproteobacteria bacterium LSUCC0684]
MRPRSSLAFRAGLALTLAMVIMAVTASFWTPHDPAGMEITSRLKPPSFAHPFGTDHFGRDVLSMIMAGSRITLGVALASVAIGMGVGIPLGLTAAALHGRAADDAVLRANDLIFAFPALVTAILIAARFGPGAYTAILAIGLFNIPVFARITRGAALPLWHRDFIRAAFLAGKGKMRISVEHILPNIAHLIIVQASIQFSLAILAEAGLSYIGLGVQPPAPSWGRLLADSQTMVAISPYPVLISGLAIILTVLGFNLMADGLKTRYIRTRETG